VRQLLPLRAKLASLPGSTGIEVRQLFFICAQPRVGFPQIMQQTANTTFKPTNFLAYVVAPATGFIEFFLKRLDADTQFLQSLFIPAAGGSSVSWTENGDRQRKQEYRGHRASPPGSAAVPFPFRREDSG
jgi:hypothetical protein